MKIVLAGGSGQIGLMLTRHFLRRDARITILTRHPNPTKGQWLKTLPGHVDLAIPNPPIQFVQWDAQTVGDWQAEIDNADVVINLAGRSVNCRYTAENKRAIMDSRVNSTRTIGQAIADSATPPKIWLQSSTATIYAHRFDAPNDELTGIIGGEEPGADPSWRFSTTVAKAQEAAANEFELPSTRLVLMRAAMVMSPDEGGVFSVLKSLVGKGLGGRNASGRQYVSWIHESDFCRGIDHIIDTPTLSGPVNLASPNPLPNSDFMRNLRRACGVSIGLPAAKWMLSIGAIIMKTETELLLKSRRVVPTKLLQSGFPFQFPDWDTAAKELANRHGSPDDLRLPFSIHRA